jgi:O-antigen/teichoic acid export membrane protein
MRPNAPLQKSESPRPRPQASWRRPAVVQVVGRLGWGVVDQAISSLGNFALGLYVAHTFTAAEFGAFTLAFIAYSVVLNAARGAATDPFVVRYSGAENRRWGPAASAASGAALVVGTVAGMMALLVGLMLPDPVGGAFVALSVGLPGLMLQDSWRFAFFAAGRGVSALANDVLWSFLFIVTLFMVDRFLDESVSWCLLVFGGSASLAGAVGALQAGVLPRPGRTAEWLRENRHLSVRYLIENVSWSGGSQARSSVLGAVAGLAAVGYVRGAELLMGPFQVILSGLGQVAVPEAARVFHRTSKQLNVFCLALASGQAVVALTWGVALAVILPLGPGTALLRDIWPPASQLLPAVTLNVVAACYLNSALAGLRAMGVARRSLRTQLVASTVYLVSGVAGAVLGGALGACWGATGANTLSAFVAWHQLQAALSHHHRQLPLTGVSP